MNALPHLTLPYRRKSLPPGVMCEREKILSETDNLFLSL